jgi:uncharacterized protein YoxC
MQDFLPIVLMVSLVVLTVVIAVVGVLTVQVLQRVKYTLDKLNDTIDVAEMKLNAIASPLQSLAGMANSFGAGVKVFESFLGFLNKGKRD